jgi:hypothetical protein
MAGIGVQLRAESVFSFDRNERSAWSGARTKQIVVSRKAGNQVYYTLRDPVLIQILDLLKQYFNAHLSETVALLGAMAADEDRRV